MIESLECRDLLAGDLAITAAQLVTNEGDPVEQVFTGEQVYLRADWTSDGLADDDSYVVRFIVDGEQLDSRTTTPNSGPVVIRGTNGVVSVRGFTDSGPYYLRGAWFASAGTHSVTVTVDGENRVAETNEGNNSLSFTFTTVPPDTLPDKLVWPLGGQQNVDWACCNYVSVRDGEDFAGGNLTIPSAAHSGIDIRIADFQKMDEGVPVFAVAAGAVLGAGGSNYDRQGPGDDSHAGEGGNGVTIAHGNGWETFYAHLARDTITVQAGDLVTPGQLLGYVGSSGNSTAPHLHFELRHYGGVVETYYAPDAYWHAPPPYAADTEQSFLSYGISNVGIRNLEPPPAINVFPGGPGQSAFVFWNVISHHHAGDVVTNKVIRPDGTFRFNSESTTSNNGTLGGVTWITLPIVTSRIGRWYWVREVNGVEKIRVPFDIVDGLGDPSIRVSSSEDILYIDGRTTPVEFGTVELGAMPAQKAFLIENHGDGDLTLGEVSIPPGFSLVGDFPTSIPSRDVVEFTVQLDSGHSGKKFGEIRFATNDPDTPLFNLNIEGEVTGASPAGSPVIELSSAALGYAFQQEPVIIDQAAAVAGSNDFRSGSLVVEPAGGISPEDRLAVRDRGSLANEIGVSGMTITYEGIVIATFSGGAGGEPLTIALNDSVPADAVETLLRSVTFENLAQAPSTRPRYIRFTLTDAAGRVSNQPVKKVVLADFEYNKAPIATPIANQTAVEDTTFELTLPGDTFKDDNTFDTTLVLAALRSDGSPLPAWLSFIPESRRFSGTPRNADVGRLTIQVTATDLGGLTAATEFEINIQNTNDPPGAIELNNTTVDEGLAGAVIGDVHVTDPDAGDSHTLSVSDDRFELVAGQLKLKPGEALDHEAASSIDLNIAATDSGSLSTSVDFTILVNDVNEFPPSIITSRLFIDENAGNGSTVGVIEVSDADTSQTMQFELSESSVFAFDSATNEIRVADSTQLDHEASEQLSISVTVTDSGTPPMSTTTDVTIVVNDVNEFTPMIDASVFRIAENTLSGTHVGFVSASDQDHRQQLSYRISEASIADAFRVIADTGELVVADASLIDFEARSDISLNVEVEDSGVPPRSNTAVITIEIEDVNEFPPSIDDQIFAVDENTPAGTFVGIIRASDDDRLQSLRYQLLGGNAGNTFSLHPSTGEITVAAPLDLEAMPRYQLLVEVTDDVLPIRSSRAAITIDLRDVNEFSPEVPDQGLQIQEDAVNGALIGFLFAADGDTSQTLSYAITGGNSDGTFGIDASTGELSVADTRRLDHETESRVSLQITVTDSGEPPRSSTGTIVIDVLDVNEVPRTNTLLADQTFGTNVLFEFALPSDAFIDPDAGDNLSYAAELVDGSPLPDWLSFDPVSRRFQGAAPDSAVGGLEIRTIAVDRGTPPLTASQTFRLTTTANPFPWQYQPEPRDTNRDGTVSPIDALVVINELNSPRITHASTQLPLPFDPAQFSFDVNADGFVSPVDALIVVNHLNQLVTLAESEFVFLDTLASVVSSVGLSAKHRWAVSRPPAMASEPSGTFSNVPPWSTTKTGRGLAHSVVDESLLEDLALHMAEVKELLSASS